jgi:hypothetical protein
MIYVLMIFAMLGERYFDPIIIKANRINLKADVNKIIIFSSQGVIPFQIDEIKNENYFEGDGKFDGEDELVFYTRHCGEKISTEKISSIQDDFEEILEVSLEEPDKEEKAFCYIGVMKEDKKTKFERQLGKVNSPTLNFSNQKDDFIVEQKNKITIFSNSSPSIKSIEIVDELGDKIKVFSGLKAEIFIKLLNLINIEKTEKDISTKVAFVKGGPVRIIRVLQPYADIGFGIKIPTSKVISYIYEGFTYVENAVPIPFNLKVISRSAYANIYLKFIDPKRFKSRENDIDLRNSIGEKKLEEDWHMWGYIEGETWAASYFIKEITKIPIERSLYFRSEGNTLEVGVHLNLLNLPKGNHKFALYGFFFPPGELEKAKKFVENPLKTKVIKIK